MKNIWIFTDEEKELISSFLAKGKQEEKINEKFAIIDFESFYKLFSNPEIDVMKKYLAIDPKIIGYKLPFLGFEETPNDIIKLNKAIEKEINKKLLVKY